MIVYFKRDTLFLLILCAAPILYVISFVTIDKVVSSLLIEFINNHLFLHPNTDNIVGDANVVETTCGCHAKDGAVVMETQLHIQRMVAVVHQEAAEVEVEAVVDKEAVAEYPLQQQMLLQASLLADVVVRPIQE